MARVIEFHMPTNFQKKVVPVPKTQLGKVIEFYQPAKKSA